MSEKIKLPVMIYLERHGGIAVCGADGVFASNKQILDTINAIADAHTLLHEMWDKADGWHGKHASSHYRGDIAAKIERVTGRRPR